MTNIHRCCVALVLALMTSATATAMTLPADSTPPEPANQFTMSGNLMTRGELRDGALSNGGEVDVARFVLARTRLTLNYKRPHMEMQITPQHSGVWGTSGGGALSLREAWVKLDGFGGLFAKLGRQSLTYDDERIIGLDEWSMTSPYHDALKLGYEGHGHKVHAVLAYNQNNSNMMGGTLYYNGGQVYKSMQTVWYHYDFNQRLGASLLFMNTGMQSELDDDKSTYYQQLMGTYWRYAPNSVTLEGSFYYQCGRNERNVPISAWMTSIEGNWDINPKWKTNIGYFRLSGDKNYYLIVPGGIGLARQTKANAFNLLFASHHQFYGAMDFFYLTAFYGGYSPGLQDFHAGVHFSPISKLNLGAKYHFLATTINVTGMNKALGHELELSARWRIIKDVTLTAGYSYMKGTDTLQALRHTTGHNRLHWGWIMLNVTPRFLQVKW